MTVANVRTIIADPIQFERTTADGDGILTTYLLPNSPVVTDSEVISVGGVAQTKPADYTIEDGTGVVIFAAAPGVGVPVEITYRFTLLSEDDIQFFLDLNGANVRRAAADALDTIASSETLIQKRITLLDLKTEGDDVADSLRAHAKTLRALADEAIDEDPEGMFDYAEMALPPFNRYKVWWKEHGRDI